MTVIIERKNKICNFAYFLKSTQHFENNQSRYKPKISKLSQIEPNSEFHEMSIFAANIYINIMF